MKKLSALILAVVLILSLSTVSLAVRYDGDFIRPDKELKLPGEFFVNDIGKVESIYFTSDYFTITKVKYEKGAELVSSVKLNGEGQIVFKFKENYLLEAPKVPNFAFKSLEVKSIKKTPFCEKNKTFIAWCTAENGVQSFVGFVPVEKYMNDKTDIDINAATEDGLYKFLSSTKITPEFEEQWYLQYYLDELCDYLVKGDGPKASLFCVQPENTVEGAKEVSYKDITIKGIDTYAEVRVFDKDMVYLEATAEPNLDIVKAYPDAELTFTGFVSSPTFNANARLEIYADEGSFLYEIKDNKLVDANFKWDSDAYAFVGKTRTLGKYVISDTELKVEGNKEDGKNPNTGV